MAVIQSVKGTRDFYPAEMAARRWLYERIRDVSERFGYQEFEAPFLERLELYAAKSGEELVREQSFVFPDRGGDMVALRPELTPSLARMVAARSKSLGTPIRWWSFGPFWRYERPQKGRSREFFQWNIDLLGAESPQADAELCAIAAALFREVGLTPESVQILLNDRRLAERLLEAQGVAQGLRASVFRLIDRRDKLSPQAWAAQARDLGLDERQLDGLRAILADRSAWRDSADLVAVFEAAEALGAREYLAYDPSVIRGLDYYTGTVFEARDTAGEHRAFLGGGRYDNLVGEVGGEFLPSVGFAMGDVVLGLALEEAGRLPASPLTAEVLVTQFDGAGVLAALSLASGLRRAGLRTEWYPEATRLPKQLKYADRQGIPCAVILGPDEVAAGEVTIKDLRSGLQSRVPQDQAAAFLLGLLRGTS